MAMALLAMFSLTVQAKNIEFLGAGATFPYPFYSKIFDAYYQEYGVKINYQAIGSGGGIQQLLSKTVDFGGTDAFMSDEDLENVAGEILHVPTCLGAVVITYNLPNSPKLNFSPEVIADIFLGKLTKWNDPQLQEVNPAVKLPNLNIVVVHRSDGSGTTFIFSDYLSKINSEWQESVGRGKSLNWPAGLGAKGNPGVAGLVQQLPGAVGYVELIYALQNDMPVGLVQNASGKYIEPSIGTVGAAANVELPQDTRVSITNTEAEEGYPISGFTWLILYKEQNYGGRDRARARALVELLRWLVHDGQQFAEPLHYAPLPLKAIERAEEILSSATFDGQRLLE
jgi:phosphate transport system substrate-binding protein